MYVCCECGATFKEPEDWEERHGLDYGPYEQLSGCPRCGGAYTETYRCDYCGEWITDDYVQIGDEMFCDDCFTRGNIRDD